MMFGGEESMPHFGSSMIEPKHRGEIQPDLCWELHVACYCCIILGRK